MYEEKKKYLKQYIFQETVINSIKEIAIRNPERSIECEERIDRCNKLRYEIEQKINNVDNPLLSELLYQKYIFGKSLEEISYILNYSKRHTERLHIKALEEFNM